MSGDKKITVFEVIGPDKTKLRKYADQKNVWTELMTDVEIEDWAKRTEASKTLIRGGFTLQ